MSRGQIDNSHFEVKIRLRIDNLPPKTNFCVLDCFCGKGLIWREIQRRLPDRGICVVSIDEKPDKNRVHLVGNNLKFLRSMDLRDFDAIDLDAYGVPYSQLQAILGAKLKKGVVIYLTFIQSRYGALPRDFLADLGYTPEMVRKIPSLFYRNGFGKLLAYLATKELKHIKRYSDNDERKHYLCFKL